MADLLKRLPRKFHLVVIPFLFMLTFLAVLPLAWRISERSRISEVGGPPPEWLPVLAFTPGNVDILWYGELAMFKKAHPDYSFLAPEGQEELLNRNLVASYRKKVPSADVFPKFEAKQISPGRQALEVGLYGDGDTIVWYEASSKELFPRRYLSTGPLFSFIPLFWSVVVTVVAWGAAYGLWRINRHARRAAG